jgi:hypothetical protein
MVQSFKVRPLMSSELVHFSYSARHIFFLKRRHQRLNFFAISKLLPVETSGSHSSEYEDDSLLGYSAM